jgi:hypothetical protein
VTGRLMVTVATAPSRVHKMESVMELSPRLADRHF